MVGTSNPEDHNVRSTGGIIGELPRGGTQMEANSHGVCDLFV